jgi:integrase-like protein
LLRTTISRILETGDASALVSLPSGAMRRHAMEAITAYAKYSGLYEKWCQIRKHYSLRWTNGDESLHVMYRFFNGESLESMLAKVKEMMRSLPPFMAKIVKFACLIGLRPSEVVESVRLINLQNNFTDTLSGTPPKRAHTPSATPVKRSPQYYNPERQALEHFRFPEIFLRQTKKAYISFVTPPMIEEIVKNITSQEIHRIPTYSAITHACRRVGIACELHLCRKLFASHLRASGIQPEIIDLLQGRVSQSILTRHYLVPKPSFKEDIIKALEQLQRQLLL